MTANYVLTLGNLYGTKERHSRDIKSEEVDVVIKAVLREMLNTAAE